MSGRTSCCLLGIVLLCPSSPLQAVLIAEESFDYAEGTKLTGCHLGTGWNGAWFTAELPTDNVVAAPSAEFAKLRTAGNRLTLTGRDVRNFRHINLESPSIAAWVVDGDHGPTLGKPGTTVWVALLISYDAGPPAHGGVHLCDGVGDLSIDPFGGKRAHQRMQLGRNNQTPTWILCRVTNGAPGDGKWPSDVQADASLRLLVYRFDFGTNDVRGKLFIDPTPGTEPDPSNAAVSAEAISPFCFNAVNVGSGGAATYTLDELRIGTEYADVAPRR